HISKRHGRSARRFLSGDERARAEQKQNLPHHMSRRPESGRHENSEWKGAKAGVRGAWPANNSEDAGKESRVAGWQKTINSWQMVAPSRNAAQYLGFRQSVWLAASANRQLIFTCCTRIGEYASEWSVRAAYS